MYYTPWQDGRVFETPAGVLAASFLLRPNTMFHPEGEWSVRLVLPHLHAYRLKQQVMPAHDDIMVRAKEMHRALPEEQRRRPMKENAFWQAVTLEAGAASENLAFAFRLPAVDRQSSLSQDATSQDATTPVTATPVTATPVTATTATATTVPLIDRHGHPVSGLSMEPDHWDAVVHFTIQQYWMRSFGAGINLRLHQVQLLGPSQRQSDGGIDISPPMKIAL